MEITNEIKAKVLAQYLGHPLRLERMPEEPFKEWAVRCHSDYHVTLYYVHAKPYGAMLSEVKLILRPLSAITDEDAIEVSQMIMEEERGSIIQRIGGEVRVYQKSGNERVYITKEWRGCFWENGEMYDEQRSSILTTECYQYLQSKGYDLPMWLLGGKTLKEAGLAVYEND
jgi:hypothetical protein